MEYSGKLYGKVAGEYFPLLETTEDVEALKKRIAELEAENEQLRIHDVRNSAEYTRGYKDGWRDCCKDVKEFG